MRPLWCEACSCSQHKSLTYLICTSVILRCRDKIISREQSLLSRKHHHTLPFKMFCVEGLKRGGKDNIWLKLGLPVRKRMGCWNNYKSKHRVPASCQFWMFTTFPLCYNSTCSNSKSRFSQLPLQSSNQTLCLSVGMWPGRETKAGAPAREELRPKQEDARADLATTCGWLNTLGR